jgi:hypothetical protein
LASFMIFFLLCRDLLPPFALGTLGLLPISTFGFQNDRR